MFLLLAFGEGARRAMADSLAGPGMNLSKVCCGLQHPRPQTPGAVFLAAAGGGDR